MNMTENYDHQPSQQYQLNESHGNQDDRSRFLKPLKVPTFSGDKQKFEDFWVLFRSLVDESAWLTKDSSEWPKMLVPNRPSEMSEMKTSKRKEGANASATLVTYSLQKEAALKRNNTCEVWRLDPKLFSSWTRKSEKSVAQPAQWRRQKGGHGIVARRNKGC